MTLRILTVPGYNGSGPGRWQTLWEREHAEYRRVELADWERPRLDRWVASRQVRDGAA